LMGRACIRSIRCYDQPMVSFGGGYNSPTANSHYWGGIYSMAVGGMGISSPQPSGRWGGSNVQVMILDAAADQKTLNLRGCGPQTAASDTCYSPVEEESKESGGVLLWA